MNRRSFFGVTLGAIAAAVLAVPWRRRRIPVTGGIDKATFSFWRNQQSADGTSLDALRANMRDLYNQCSNVESI